MKEKKDNSIKMAVGTIAVCALIGLLITHDAFGALRGACVGGLIVFIGEFYPLFQKTASDKTHKIEESH